VGIEVTAMIRVHVFPPLPKMLGLAKAYKRMVLELPVEPDASLQTLFRQLSTQYPAFGVLSDPKPGDKLRGILVIVNGKHVPESEYHQTPLRDGAEVSLLPPYGGG